MSSYSTKDFKSGLKVIMDKEPYNIISSEFFKPGKGHAFYRIKFRNLINNKIINKTFNSGVKLEAADIIEIEMQFLFQDGETWHFMHPKTFEQYEANTMAMGDNAQWIQQQDNCMVLLWNNVPLTVSAPNFVILAVTDTVPGVKGDTVSGGSKMATVETGASIRVPLFVNIGDKIKIDTRDGSYVSRASDD